MATCVTFRRPLRGPARRPPVGGRRAEWEYESAASGVSC